MVYWLDGYFIFLWGRWLIVTLSNIFLVMSGYLEVK
jgi:hypothetical protein